MGARGSLPRLSSSGAQCPPWGTGMAGSIKSVREVLPAQRPHWVGDGFNVYPVFADKAFTNEVSPFLMFDYGAPREFPANNSKKLGVGEHPHRGFETVTIAFQGEVEHGDSVGNRGVIGPGDVQWMTAGRGIVHEEFHSRAFAKAGGTFEMCQLWVNLPREHKMTAPRYQEIVAKDIPSSPLFRVASPDGPLTPCPGSEGSVRVIAGKFGDATGPAKTFSPVELWDVAFVGAPTSGSPAYAFETPPGGNVIVFCRAGSLLLEQPAGKKATRLEPQDVAILDRADAGTRLLLLPAEAGTQVLILAGKPLDEPIANRGPFVMSTQQELSQAVADYQSGKFGR